MTNSQKVDLIHCVIYEIIRLGNLKADYMNSFIKRPGDFSDYSDVLDSFDEEISKFRDLKDYLKNLEVDD